MEWEEREKERRGGSGAEGVEKSVLSSLCVLMERKKETIFPSRAGSPQWVSSGGAMANKTVHDMAGGVNEVSDSNQSINQSEAAGSITPCKRTPTGCAAGTGHVWLYTLAVIPHQSAATTSQVSVSFRTGRWQEPLSALLTATLSDKSPPRKRTILSAR